MLNLEKIRSLKILQTCLPHLSDIATSPWEIQKVIFGSIIDAYFWLSALSQKKINCNPLAHPTRKCHHVCSSVVVVISIFVPLWTLLLPLQSLSQLSKYLTVWNFAEMITKSDVYRKKTRKRKDTLTQNKYSKLKPGLAGIQQGTLRVCKLSVVRVMYGLMLIRRKKKRIRSRPRNNAIFPTAMIRRQMVTVTSHSGSATMEPRRPQFQTEWSRLQGNTVDLASRII